MAPPDLDLDDFQRILWTFAGHRVVTVASRTGMLRLLAEKATTPEDVAGVIFLLSQDEARWINGEVIRVDGGEHISGATR